MNITKDEIKNLAKLAYLDLTEEDVKTIEKDLEIVIEHFKNLENENIENYKEDYPEEITSRTREDKVVLFKEKLKLNNQNLNNYIEIPKIID